MARFINSYVDDRERREETPDEIQRFKDNVCETDIELHKRFKKTGDDHEVPPRNQTEATFLLNSLVRNQTTRPRLGSGNPNSPPAATEDGPVDFKADVWAARFIAWLSGESRILEGIESL